jgi:hypothetical protein
MKILIEERDGITGIYGIIADFECDTIEANPREMDDGEIVMVIRLVNN